MITVDVLTIKLDTCYFSSIGTRNSTRENMKYNINVLQIKNYSKANLLFIIQSTRAVFAICSCILCFKKLPALDSSVHMLRKLAQKKPALGPATP